MAEATPFTQHFPEPWLSTSLGRCSVSPQISCRGMKSGPAALRACQRHMAPPVSPARDICPQAERRGGVSALAPCCRHQPAALLTPLHSVVLTAAHFRVAMLLT